MRCNIFRPLVCNTGEFLTFQQYTNDLTKEQAEKDSYRVVPSRFVVLDVDLFKVFNLMYDDEQNVVFNEDNPTSRYVELLEDDDNTTSWSDRLALWASMHQSMPDDRPLETGYNNIIPQIFQSAYENATTMWGQEPQSTEENYSRKLLWKTLENAGFLTPTTDDQSRTYWEEVKYIGDINFHTDRNIDNYDYSEIYCHIPASATDGYYYISRDETQSVVFPSDPMSGQALIQGWTLQTYPQHDPLQPYNLTEYNSGEYRNQYELMDMDLMCMMDNLGGDETWTPRDNDNREFQFNTILVFYNVLQWYDGNWIPLHRDRPMGIYFTGQVEVTDGGVPVNFMNKFTKYISNEDAYGQGAAFGLRIMSRVVPTPNSSSYQMSIIVEDGEPEEYNTIVTALGRISDTLLDQARSFTTMEEMAQQYKDHLAMFRNSRTNVPYPREVNGRWYWFVNGRNTGQPCTPTPDELNQ